MTHATDTIRLYFAVRTDGCGGYLNAAGLCVDRGWICSPRREDAEDAALACVTRPRTSARRGEVRSQRTAEVRSVLAPAT